MKVILKKDCKGLGKVGEMVEASDGYARNFLLPKGIASPADAQNLTEMNNANSAKQHKIDETEKQANEDAKLLDGKIIVLKAKAGANGKLFGSVTKKEIAHAVNLEFKLNVDKKKLVVDDIKAFGTYEVTLKLFGKISADFRVKIIEE